MFCIAASRCTVCNFITHSLREIYCKRFQIQNFKFQNSFNSFRSYVSLYFSYSTQHLSVFFLQHQMCQNVWRNCCALYSFINCSTAIFEPWSLFLFRNPIHTAGRTPWAVDQPVARPLPAHRRAQTQNRRTQTFMPRVGFEHTISAFGQKKTVHAIDYAATICSFTNFRCSYNF
jgi:hypothetical protein